MFCVGSEMQDIILVPKNMEQDSLLQVLFFVFCRCVLRRIETKQYPQKLELQLTHKSSVDVCLLPALCIAEAMFPSIFSRSWSLSLGGFLDDAILQNIVLYAFSTTQKS